MSRDPRVLEVSLSWGEALERVVLAVQFLRKGDAFLVGEDAQCDAVIPAEMLGSDRVEILRWRSDVRVMAPAGARMYINGVEVSAAERTVAEGERVLVELSGVFIDARFVSVDREDVPIPAKRASLAFATFAFSLLLHGALLAAMISAPPSADQTSAHLQIIRQLLASGAAREEEQDEHLLPTSRVNAELASSRGAAASSAVSQSLTQSPLRGSEQAKPGITSDGIGSAAKEPVISGTGEGDGVEVTDVGGLLASLLRRPKLPGGIARLPDRDGPEASLRSPYPIVGDNRIDKDTLRRIVRPSADRVRICYRGVAPGDHVAITFHIGHSGNVVNVEDASGAFPNADVHACVVRALSTLVFPEPDRGSARFTYPLKIGASGQ